MSERGISLLAVDINTYGVISNSLIISSPVMDWRVAIAKMMSFALELMVLFVLLLKVIHQVQVVILEVNRMIVFPLPFISNRGKRVRMCNTSGVFINKRIANIV